MPSGNGNLEKPYRQTLTIQVREIGHITHSESVRKAGEVLLRLGWSNSK